MKKFLLTLLVSLAVAVPAFSQNSGQSTNVRTRTSDPSSCTKGADVYTNTSSTDADFRLCTQANTFKSLPSLNKVQSGSANYATDTGTANAYVVTLSPVPTAYTVGFPVYFKAANANTGASTLNVNGLGAVTITKRGGTALAAGDIPVNASIHVVYDGTNFEMVSGAGGGSASAGTQNAVQKSDGAGGFQAGSSTDDGTTFSVNEDFKSKGPNPGVNITAAAFGGRAVNPNIAPATTGITATCNGTTTLTLSTASSFVNGDGVRVDKCGVTNTMSTPAAPTVQPVIMAGPLGSEDFVNANPGSTTYSYSIVEIDKLGAVTANSTTGSTTTGLPALGTVNFSVSTSSLNGTTATVNTVAATDLVPRALVYFNSNVSGGDSYLVATTPSSTQFTYAQQGSSGLGANASLFNGASLSYTVCNHLILPAHSATGFQYAIYAGGTFIGMSRPAELFFEDCGSTIRGSISTPREVPSTTPVTATNDPLVTTIVSGAGTTTLVVANSASQSIAGVPILFDDAPAIAAAVAFAGTGTPVILPTSSSGTSYVINSYLNLTGTIGVTLRQAGSLVLNEPIELPQGSTWNGLEGGGAIANQAFGINQYRKVSGTNRFPFVYITGSAVTVQGLSFSGLKDSALLVLVDSSNFNGTFKNCVFSTGASSATVDYLSTGLMFRGLKNIFIENILLNSLMSNNLAMGPWAGELVVKGSVDHAEPGGQLKIKGIYTGSKLIAVDYTVGTSDMQGVIDGLYTQGCRTPIVQLSQNSVFTLPLLWVLRDVEVDTSACAAIANLTASGFSSVTFENYSGASAGYRGPAVTGNPFVTVIGGCCGNPPINSGSVFSFNGGLNTGNPKGYNFSDFLVNVGGIGTFQHTFTSQPADPVLTVLSGGSLSVGVHSYKYHFYDINGNAGPLSNSINATTTSGNQTVQVQVGTPPLGAIGFYVYEGGRGRIQLGTGGAGCGFNQSGGLVISDNGGVQCGNSAFVNGGAADAGVRNQNVFAPTFSFIDTNNTGLVSTTTNPVPLTANRSIGIPDQSGLMVLTGSTSTVFDNFNRTNGALGANWTNVSGSLQVSGNTVLGTNGAAQNMSVYTGVKFNADQFAAVTWSVSGAQLIQVQVRGSSSLVTAYECSISTTTLAISKESNNSFSSLTSTTITGAVGDTVWCQVQGTTITAIHIPATGAITTITATDASITSGSPGIRLFGNTVTAGDNFIAGSYSHPLANLDSEQSISRIQHFLQGVTLGASSGPTLNAVQGNTSKVQLATSFTNGNLFKSDANGNTADAAIPATVSGSGSLCLTVSCALTTPTIGGGSTLTKYSRIAVTLSPAAVSANSCAAQSFTVTGLSASDILISVTKPTEQAGLMFTKGHVTATDTATVNFCNVTASPITPTASESYSFVVVQ
jgi:hypothetical protein